MPSKGNSRCKCPEAEMSLVSSVKLCLSLLASGWFCIWLLICFVHLSEVLSTLHCIIIYTWAAFAHPSYSADSLNLSRTLCLKGEQLMATFIKPRLSRARRWSKCFASVSSFNPPSNPTRSVSLSSSFQMRRWRHRRGNLS